MHDHLKSIKQNPTQKFCKNLINFEKPQKLFKNPKLRLENMKCMIEWRNKTIPDEENFICAEVQVGKMKRLSLRCLGEREVSFYRERSEKMREKSH